MNKQKTDKVTVESRKKEREDTRRRFKAREKEREDARLAEAERKKKAQKEDPVLVSRAKERADLREKNGFPPLRAKADDNVRSIIAYGPFPELWKFLWAQLGIDAVLGLWRFSSRGFVLGKTTITENDIASMKADIEVLKEAVAGLTSEKK